MIGVWKVSGDDQPARLSVSALKDERQLQDWVLRDPSLLEDGLNIIGDEVHIDSARRIDLLALDQAGQLVVIELKAGKLARAVVAQTLDYLAHLSAMPVDDLERCLREAVQKQGQDYDALGLAEIIRATPRAVRGIAAGVDERSDAAAISAYLAEHDVPLKHVRFSLATDGSQQLLVRELDEAQESDTRSRGVERRDPREVLQSTLLKELGAPLERLLAATHAAELGLTGYRWSVMVSPPARRSQMLFTLSDEHGRELKLYFSADRFAEHFDVTTDRVREVIGEPLKDRCPLTPELCDRLAEHLPELTKARATGDE